MWWSLFLIGYEAIEPDKGRMAYHPIVSFETRQQCESGLTSYILEGEYRLKLKNGWKLKCIRTDDKVSLLR